MVLIFIKGRLKRSVSSEVLLRSINTKIKGTKGEMIMY